MNDDVLTPNQMTAATKISDVLSEYFMDADVGNIEDGECVVLLATDLLQSGNKAIGIDDMRKILDEVFWKEFTAIVTTIDLIKLVAISNQLLEMSDDELTQNQRVVATKISDILKEYFLVMEDGKTIVRIVLYMLQSGKKAIDLDDMRWIIDKVFWEGAAVIVEPIDLIKLVAISNQFK